VDRPWIQQAGTVHLLGQAGSLLVPPQADSQPHLPGIQMVGSHRAQGLVGSLDQGSPLHPGLEDNPQYPGPADNLQPPGLVDNPLHPGLVDSPQHPGQADNPQGQADSRQEQEDNLAGLAGSQVHSDIPDIHQVAEEDTKNTFTDKSYTNMKIFSYTIN